MSEVEEKILRMVQDGILSSAEAAKLLDTLAASQRDEGFDDEVGEPILEPDQELITPQVQPDLDWFRSFWQIPFFVSLTIFLLSAWGTWVAWQASGTFATVMGMLCLTPLTVLALLAVLLSFWSQFAYWFHLRVQEKDGTRIAISLPLPIIIIQLVLRFAGRFVGEHQAANLFAASELLAALGEQDEPLYIAVDDDDGDQVQIYIG
jgi:hypothetical protein